MARRRGVLIWASWALGLNLILSSCAAGTVAMEHPTTEATPTVGADAPAATDTPDLAATVPSTLQATITPSPPTDLPTLTVAPRRTLSPSATPSPTVTPTAGPTPDGTIRSVQIPILMYHYVSAPPGNADRVRKDLSVSPERFESHLAYLKDSGYHTVLLDDLLYALTQGRALPEKPIILTFDDGYEDNYLNAFPLLTRYGMVGNFFIITDLVNEGYPEYLTWPQIEQMAASGQRFGSHSRNHPDLRGKPVDYLVWQALGGAEAIQEHLGYHPRWISYPSGGYDAEAIAVYKSANYWGGLAINPGTTERLADIFDLPRLRVRGTYDAADLAALLAIKWE